MAYLVKRGNTYHLCHNADGKRTRMSLGLRANVAQEVRRAKELEAEYTLKERRRAVASPAFGSEGRWEMWVTEWAAMKYRSNAGSHRRWESVWRTLLMFFEDKKIAHPQQLTRAHCFEYFEWRSKPDPERGKFAACHNTTLLEITKLGSIMKEAVLRGFAPANPCRELGIGQEDKKKPSDLSDEDLKVIEEAIAQQPAEKREYLWPSYLIARFHGVRLQETHFNPMKAVNLKTMEITFLQKGKRTRTKPLHPKLVPLFTELQERKATETFKKPKSFSAKWFTFFSGLKLPSEPDKPCFHSFRVVVQNRLRRAGVPDEIRRMYLSHERQVDVHEGYSRIKVEELKVCHAAL
jgi:integrase